jgi:hypothetical protein
MELHFFAPIVSMTPHNKVFYLTGVYMGEGR